MIRCLSVSLFATALAAAVCSGHDTKAVTGLSSTAQSNQQWWFPSTMPVGSRYSYHLTYTTVATSGDRSVQTAEESDFAIAVSEDASKPGRVVRLVAPEPGDQVPSQASSFLLCLGHANPDGVRVTTDGVWLWDAPLLRGPWRKGDRFTFGGGVFFFATWVGAAHVEVVSADSSGARLVYESWVGRRHRKTSGNGELVLTSDERGLFSVSATWLWRYDTTTIEHRLKVSRTQVTEAAPGDPVRDATGEDG